jgi:acyl-CoA synthetase (AMP-forming)/AMP-acid ligase II
MPENSAAIIDSVPLEPTGRPLTLARLIRGRARELAGRTALIDAANGRELSYGELDRLVGRFSAGLFSIGLAAGDRVLIFMPNRPEWIVAALGALSAGGIVSGSNSLYSAEEVAHQLSDSGARIVVTIPAFLPKVNAAIEGRAGFRVIVVDGDGGPGSFEELIVGTGTEPEIAADPDAIAMLPYSSGTSGLPKGVILTHRNLCSNILQNAQVRMVDPGETTLAVLPMFHVYGFGIAQLSLYLGSTVVTLPRFEPESYLRAIQDFRITQLSTVPPMLQFLAMHPLVESYDLSSVTRIGCGAAPLGADLEQRAADRLRCEVAQGYGMTEATMTIAVTVHGQARAGSVGRLVPGTQARVVCPDTQVDLERGQSGEIWFRGPQMFQGYLNNPSATTETVRGGWVRTGDLGYFDDDDYLFVTDRLKELIKVKAFQVAPAELEALLLNHPAVADVAVIGRADARCGEVPVAFIVPRGTIDGATLKAWLAAQVVEYKCLADVKFCEAIPKSASGKILRRLLRERDRTSADAV